MENEIARIVKEAATIGWDADGSPDDAEYLEHVDAMLQESDDMGNLLDQI